MEAYEDLKYLLSRGYRKKTALNFVANHYLLDARTRHILARCVFSDVEIEERKSKLVPVEAIRDRKLGIDGYNVLITFESLLAGRAVLCEDGFVRDLELRRGYEIHERTEENLRTLLGFLADFGPSEVWVLYDKNVSGSGRLARLTRSIMEELGLKGGAKTEKVPDLAVTRFDIAASSDVSVIKKATALVDVPGEFARKRGLRIPHFLELFPYIHR
ncbi:DUF434 domain-containing protein [Pyrococcus yayanosii]|uniref:DUF434 domain-containing protein n=1 Tax=Pyrococcus yayanosii (strain CH1 / JCM 16557) TaxID=529709 RepID=F8AF81_PYRYC|nr:DUF434 domain-containing protein [Pyrococcus yayanosii]AEH24909.1 hypothetical protein PYCH_12310 [Pyrococcus yayanosii CH1]